MQRIFINLFVSVATFVIGVTAASPWTAFRTTFDSQDKQEILRVERQYLDAHIKRDAAALDRVLADDFYFSYQYGGAASKTTRLALLENPDFTFESIDTRNVEVTVRGDRAYVFGEAVVRGNYRGRDFVTAPYSYMRTFERRGGAWQILSVRCDRLRSR